jgi:hypothetical protein
MPAHSAGSRGAICMVSHGRGRVTAPVEIGYRPQNTGLVKSSMLSWEIFGVSK